MNLEQSDSTTVNVEDISSNDDAQHTTYVRPRTVYQVIRSLPKDATPEQQDSAVQANFKADTLVWAKKAKLGLPDFNINNVTVQKPQIDLYKTQFTTQIPWTLERIPYNQEGIAGDPLPYQLKTDDFVTSVVLISFLLVVWVISRSTKFLAMQIKNFFYTPDNNAQLASSTENELKGQLFLVFQTCFVLGILFFIYTQEKLIDVFNQISPYKLLALDIGIFIAYYIIKIITYTFVNWVFFDSYRNKLWAEFYSLTVLASGVALFPIVLLIVYFDIKFAYVEIATISIIIITKILLFLKAHPIFFDYPLGYLHLFLYFCTLEILPLLTIWRILVYANNYLVTIF